MKLVPEELKGQGLHVYCNKCKRQLSANAKCGNSDKPVSSCQSKDKWKYKMIFHVPEPNGPGRKKTLICKSRTLSGAISELEKTKKQRSAAIAPIKKQRTLQEGIRVFLDKKFGTGEYLNTNTKVSKEHQKDILRVIGRFLESLRRSGRNPDAMLLNDLDDRILGPFYSLLSDLELGPKTTDRHTRIMRNFFRFIENRGMYSGGNFFMTHDVSSVASAPVAVTDKEFAQVLSVTTEENSEGLKGTNRTKHYFRNWLPYMMRLARLTGLRTEELFQLRTSDITTFRKEGKEFKLIVVHNLKVERLKAEKNETVLKVIPVTQEIQSLLDEIHENNISSEKVFETNFAFGPFKDFIGRAFTHFYKVAFPGEQHKCFKQLRKANYSDIAGILGEEANLLTGHSGNAVLDKHYVDKIMAAIKLMEIEQLKNS